VAELGASSVGRLDGEKLEVAHCGYERVGDIAGLAHGIDVEAKVALGGVVHGTRDVSGKPPQ
jgi:hypothetical protein